MTDIVEFDIVDDTLLLDVVGTDDGIPDHGTGYLPKDTSPDPVTDVEPETVTPDSGSDDIEDSVDCVDEDGDGYGPGCQAGPDCAPDDAALFRSVSLYPDADFDGFGFGNAVTACAGDEIPPGFSETADDCDDSDATVFPGAREVPDDNKANSCSGEDIKAATADGIFVVPGNPDTNPGTREQPVGTLTAAMEKAAQAGLSHVFAALGNLNESITVSGSFSIHGGYDKTTWTRGLQTTRLSGVSEVTVFVDGHDFVMDQFQVFGTAVEPESGPAPASRAFYFENAQAFLRKVSVGGASVDTDWNNQDVLDVTGVYVNGGNVIMFDCRVGDGSPMIQVFGGTGPLVREIRSFGIQVEAGRLSMAGGSLGFGPEITMWDSAGTATATAISKGILVSGGTAVVSGVDLYGSVDVTIDDATDDGVVAQATATADGTGAEVAGGQLYVINCIVGSGQSNSEVDLAAAGSVESPIDASGSAVARLACVRANGGRLVVAHSNLFTERFSDAITEVTSGYGNEISVTNLSARILEAGADADLVVFNSAGYSQISAYDSALIAVSPQSRMTMMNSVWWDLEYGVCRVHDGSDCQVSEGGLDSLGQIDGVVRAGDNLIQDQLWDWWDTVAPGSPLIDAAMVTWDEGIGVFVDRAGNARPRGDGYDIGAYEFQP